MTPQALLNYLQARGAVLQVRGDRLRVDAPKGMLTAEVRRMLAAHKWELIAALRHVPGAAAGGGDRLNPAVCERILAEAFATVGDGYEQGAVGLLESDPELRRRFHVTEETIAAVAKAGGTEAAFRAAVGAFVEVICEAVGRQRAQREHEVGLPADATRRVRGKR